MKRFFLISSYFPKKSLKHFLKFSGKEKVNDFKILLIENAADVYEESKKGFMYETRDQFKVLGFEYELCDLRLYFSNTNQLKEKIKKYDLIWFGGGNTYHLIYCIYKTGFDTLGNIIEENNIILGGGSAGAIIFAPSLMGYENIDSPELAPEYITKGLAWFPFQIIPHWNRAKYQAKLEKIEDIFKKEYLDYITLEDKQSIIGTAENYKII